MKVHDKIAKENIRWHQEQNKIRHALEANVPNFQLGDLVLIKVNKVPKGLSRKLFNKSEGPYRIVELGPNFTYKLRRCSDNKLHASMMNASNLKYYHDPEIHRQKYEPLDLPGQISDSEDEGSNETNQGQNNANAGQNIDDPTEVTGQSQSRDLNNQKSQTNGDRNQGLNDESRDLGEKSDESSDMEEYDPQKKWKFKKFLRGRFRNGRREIYVEWEDGSKSWEPDSCFDDDVLEMIDRKFTKLGTIRKTCFKRNY